MAVGTSPGDASRDFAAAINAGSVDAAAACWTPDAVILAPGGTPVSGEDLRARLEQLVAGRVALTIEVSDEIETAGVAMAKTRSTMASPGRPAVELQASVVYQWAGDRWRIAIDRIDGAA
jgi:ketosteroid isomerase-like protein